MSLFARIFLGYFLLIAVLGYVFFRIIKAEIEPSLRISTEETMVETANVLAAMISSEAINGEIDTRLVEKTMKGFEERTFGAQIWELKKDAPTFRVYIADINGVVIYDSAGLDIGADYSQWNDVYLTLRGEYGARSTRENPNETNTSVLYIAAPILHQSNIIGVLTVSKPARTLEPIVRVTTNKITRNGILTLMVTVLIGFLLAKLLSRSLQKLRRYVHRIETGERVGVPQFIDGEFQGVANAIEDMRVAIEGKKYVEEYVHNLTHELKSPITAIQASAKLLTEDMNEHDRMRFVENIDKESRRMQMIIDRVLQLAEIENKSALERFERIDMQALMNEIVQDNETRLRDKSLNLIQEKSRNVVITGDRFLIRQAINNVLDNAIRHSSSENSIRLTVEKSNNYALIVIEDNGDGIPEFALNKVFDRFYKHTDGVSEVKTTGLGLNFVKEITALHRGSVSVSNQKTGGCKVELYFPSNLHIKHI